MAALEASLAAVKDESAAKPAPRKRARAKASDGARTEPAKARR
jgi:hypothetical protein